MLFERTCEMESDYELYTRFLNGDTTSYDKLMLRYGDNLTYYLKGFLRSMEDAEDLMIEAFAWIMAKKPRIKDGNFKAYLFKVGHHLVSHFYKKSKRLEVFSLSDINDKMPDGKSFEEKILNDEKKRILHRCIERLEPMLREVIWLIYFEKMSYENAAYIMGVNKNKVHHSLEKARLDLKKELKKEGIEDAY